MGFKAPTNQWKLAPIEMQKSTVNWQIQNASNNVSNKKKLITTPKQNCRKESDKLFLKTPKRYKALQKDVTIFFVVSF